ncbi:MAG TPA: ATP-binding protein [Pilimelia sp.]|nr:ATP-binding protein [Pilimelia sp.]
MLTTDQDTALLGLLEEVTRAANEADRVIDAGRLALGAVCRLTGWSVGHLCVPIRPQDTTFVSAGIWTGDVGDFPTLRAVSSSTVFPPGVGLVGRVAATGRPAWTADASVEPGFLRHGAGPDLGVGSAAAFAITGRQGVAAVLEFLDRHPQVPDERLLGVMADLGVQLGRVADREEVNARLAAGAHHLAQVISASVEAFVSMTADGTIEEWNHAAERTFGISREEALGRRLVDLIVPPRLRGAYHDGVARFLANGTGQVGGQRLEATAWRDGAEFPVELVVWTAQDGDRVQFHAFLHDISDRQRAEQALRGAYRQEKHTVEQLTELDRVKDDFIDTISHELRTPLTSIAGYLEVLTEGDAGPVPPVQQRMLHTIGRNVGRMRELVADLSVVNGAETRPLALVLEPISLPYLISRTVDAVTPIAQLRQQHITTQIEAGVDVLASDPDHLARAIQALLSNAVKFSPDGAPILLRATAAEDSVWIAVTDRGAGIHAADQVRIFERFYRTEAATRDAAQGAGLGLTIARLVVEAHGGRLTVRSAPGQGSTFTIQLPVRPVTER